MGELGQANQTRIGVVLWREKWVIIASLVVMIGLAAAYTVTSAKVYEANGIIQVSVPTSAPGTTDTTSANQALAQNYAALLTSAGFLTQVRSKIDNGRLSVNALQGSSERDRPTDERARRPQGDGPIARRSAAGRAADGGGVPGEPADTGSDPDDATRGSGAE